VLLEQPVKELRTWFELGIKFRMSSVNELMAHRTGDETCDLSHKYACVQISMLALL
jgi:hypothetical protein